MMKDLNTDTFDCEFIDTKTGEKIGEFLNIESYNMIYEFESDVQKSK